MPSTRATLSRRTLVQAAVASLCLPTAHSANAEIALATAINRAARFRALSQRSTKAYAQIVLDVLPDNARQVLATAQRLITQGFDDLAQGGFSTDITQQIANTRVEATALITLLNQNPKREGIASVSAQADKMLAQANKTTEMLQAVGKSGNARLVNIAGKQRMLSQRMAKNYFLIAANITPGPAREQIDADRAEFKTALAILQKSPISTSAIRGDLELTAAQWFFFEAALNKSRDTQALKDMATTSERLLELTNSLTNQYEAALKDVLGVA